jgi:hypothetical protein
MADEILTGSEQVPVAGSGPTPGGGDVPSTPAAGGMPTTPEGTSGTGIGGSPAPEELYEVKVDGKTLKVTRSELLNGYSRHSAFTRRMQELAQREQDWTTRLGTYEKAIQETRALLSDRNRLAQILQGLPNEEGAEGDELLTRGQVEQMRQKWFEEYQAHQDQRAQAERYQAQVESLKTSYLGELKGVYDSMSEQFPVLKKLPLFNELRLKVGSFEPQSISDAKALLANEIRELAKENGWNVGGEQSAPRTGIPGIEPPGGVGVMPSEGQKFASVRDPGLKEAVRADIEQIIRASLQS